MNDYFVKLESALPALTENEKLNIYFHVSENSGVGYYRQYLQAMKLREHGLANIKISDFRFGEGDHKEPDTDELFQIAIWADIIVVGRKDIKEFYAQWGGIREFFNMSIVMDTDDNVRFVRPHNPGYQGYHPGSENIVWNKYATAKVFDAITVTTQPLADITKKENPKVYVLPNNLDVKWWDSCPKKEKDDFIRIGFLCSSAHAEGVMIIKKPVLEIMQKYPQVKFLMTTSYQHFFADYPDEIKARIEWIPWIKLDDWAQGVKALGIDIGLAPLADNMFNRSKSNLRWMEYAMAGMAPIVSPVAPYLCVKNGETGVVAKEQKEWYDAMDRLITDDAFRKKIQDGARNEVVEKYNIDKNIGIWYNVYKEIHDKFTEYFGKKKQFIKIKKGKYKALNSPKKD